MMVRLSLLSLPLVFAQTIFGQGIITTVAGTDKTFPAGGINALAISLAPYGTSALDRSGNLYFIDNSVNQVLRLTPGGTLSVVAGNGLRGFSGDGGPATKASLSFPYSIALDNSGNLFIADFLNYRIRKVDPGGRITTVAGNGVAGHSGDNGPALNASFSECRGIAVDSQGNLYVADTYNHVVRKISTGGIVSAFAGNGQRGYNRDGISATSASLNEPYAVLADAAGNVYIADQGNDRIRKVTPGGAISTVAGNGQRGYNGDGMTATAASLSGANGLALDAAGNLYIADYGNQRIRKVDTSNIISTIAGSGQPGFSGDGGAAIRAALNFPAGVSVDAAGNVFVSDSNNGRIRKVSGGNINTVAGSSSAALFGENVPAAAAILYAPNSVAFDTQGSLYIADTGNHRIRKVAANGIITTYAGNGTAGFSGDNGPATAATLFDPFGVAVDRVGNVYVADTVNHRVRRIRPDGIITTIAGIGTPGYSGDGIAATNANLFTPEGVAVDPAGNVYIADSGNHVIRAVTLDGRIQTVIGNGRAGYSGDGGRAAFASLYFPEALAIDPFGNIFIADTGNGAVRKVTPAGIITTVAGPPTLAQPQGVASDASGTIYIGDYVGSRVYALSPSGALSIVAGTGVDGFAGDGGLAARALLSASGLAVDRGNLYIADMNSNRVRAVLAAPPSVQMAPVSLTFRAPSGDAPTASQSVTLSSVAGLGFTASTSDSWIRVSPGAGVMPAPLQIAVDPGALTPGTYQGRVAVQAAGGNPASLGVQVTAVIAAGQPPVLAVDTPGLRFNLVQGTGDSQQQLLVNNRGSGTLNYSVSAAGAGGSWLSVTPGARVATPASPGMVAVKVSPVRMSPGTYSGAVTITATPGGSATVPVTMTVAAAQPKILLSQTGLTFQVIQGGAALPKAFSLVNSGQGQLFWSAKATLYGNAQSWLALNPVSGTVAAPFTEIAPVSVSVTPGGLAPGRYYGQVEISAPGADNSPQIVSVLLTVLAAGSPLSPEVAPTSLVFSGAPGRSPGSQDIQLANPTPNAITFTSAQTGGDATNAFQYLPRSGVIGPGQTAKITVQPDFSRLTSGIGTGTLGVQFSDGSVQSIRIVTAVAAAAGLGAKGDRSAGGCTPTSIRIAPATPTTLTAAAGDAIPIAVNIVDNCGQAVTDAVPNLSPSVSFSNGDEARRLTHVGDGRWEATYQPKNASVPQFKATVNASASENVGDRLDLSVGLGSGGDSPIIDRGAVLNGASFAVQAPLVAPGSLISIFGNRLAATTGRTAGPRAAAAEDVQVKIGDRSLNLLYAGENQINAQVPFDLPANSDLPITVRRGNTVSVPEPVTIAPAQPGIFTVNQQGSGQGIIVNGVTNVIADSANPVKAGDAVVIYCTGLGKVDVPLKPGDLSPVPAAKTLDNPTVTIDGKPAQVFFSGLTPGFVGLYQINAFVPQGVRSGPVPVEVTISGQSTPSNKVVTMAVR